MAIPPLHHGVHGAGVHGVGLHAGERHFHVVDNVQHRNGDDEGAEEPVGHIDVGGGALHQGAEEDDGIGDPYHSDGDINRPLQLGILFGGGVTQRQRDGGREDDCLPAPEDEGCQRATKQSGLTGALHHVKRGGHQCTDAEGEDHCVGMEGPQTTVSQPRGLEVEGRPDQLGCDQYANRHADNSPDNRHDGKLANNGVVVLRMVSCMAHRYIPLPMLLLFGFVSGEPDWLHQPPPTSC